MALETRLSYRRSDLDPMALRNYLSIDLPFKSNFIKFFSL